MNPIHPSTTALDARNTAQVIAHLGHGRESYINPYSASPCLVGAVMLATDSELTHWNRCIGPEPGEGWRATIEWTYLPIDGPGQSARADAVLQALTPLLPDHCNHDHQGPCALDDSEPVGDGWARITHYNDHVCTGGEDAIALLIEVAQKIEADL